MRKGCPTVTLPPAETSTIGDEVVMPDWEGVLAPKYRQYLGLDAEVVTVKDLKRVMK
jgi:hypothetical protein